MANYADNNPYNIESPQGIYYQYSPDGVNEWSNDFNPLTHIYGKFKVGINGRYTAPFKMVAFDGEKGEKGEQGVNGIQGEQGEQGIQGTSGSDGVGLEYSWSGTSLGVKREDQVNYVYTPLKGEKGDTGDSGAEYICFNIALTDITEDVGFAIDGYNNGKNMIVLPTFLVGTYDFHKLTHGYSTYNGGTTQIFVDTESSVPYASYSQSGKRGEATYDYFLLVDHQILKFRFVSTDVGQPKNKGLYVTVTFKRRP